MLSDEVWGMSVLVWKIIKFIAKNILLGLIINAIIIIMTLFVAVIYGH